MEGNSTQKPQLVMQLDSLENLPQPNLPSGYLLRHFRSGYERAWNKVIGRSFLGRNDFQSEIAEKDYFKPERVFFIFFAEAGDVDAEDAVATASAWHKEGWGERTGYLHMVGVVPAHRGKGLGLRVSAAALRRMAEEDKEQAVLETDDFRFAAIKTYLKLGFRPKVVHQNQPERWRKVLRKLETPELIEDLNQ